MWDDFRELRECRFDRCDDVRDLQFSGLRFVWAAARLAFCGLDQPWIWIVRSYLRVGIYVALFGKLPGRLGVGEKCFK